LETPHLAPVGKSLWTLSF